MAPDVLLVEVGGERQSLACASDTGCDVNVSCGALVTLPVSWLFGRLYTGDPGAEPPRAPRPASLLMTALFRCYETLRLAFRSARSLLHRWLCSSPKCMVSLVTQSGGCVVGVVVAAPCPRCRFYQEV